jgi:hypothetical protein
MSYVILSSQLLSNANEMSLRLILSFATCRELMCVLVQDWQFKDMARFCCNQKHFSVVGIDPTFNLGEFSLTVVIFTD